MVERCLRRAYPARSERQICERAAADLGVAPNTIRAAMRRGDGRFSLIWRILSLGAAAGENIEIGGRE